MVPQNKDENRNKISAPPLLQKHRAWPDFIKFHVENTGVLRAIVLELERAREAGREKASVKAIINYLRWNMYVNAGGQDYAINDKFTGIYTHLIAYNFPEFRDMIETRELRAIDTAP